MGRKRRATVVAVFYSVVMNSLLCFSLLTFVAWFSHYHKCFGGPCVCLWPYRFCGGAVLWCCWCLSFVWCGRAWVAMC
jgi:hypothetical protein